MPTSKEEMKILHERAELIAKKTISKIQQNDIDSYVHFYLGETEKYGIDYHDMKEVIINTNPTPLPCAPSYIAGVINHRGALLSVLDLKHFLFNHLKDPEKKTSIIIVSANHITMGILVDRIIGNIHYDKKTLDTSFPSEKLIKTEYILGLHQGKTAILNIPIIFSDIDLQLSKNPAFQGDKP
jgi:purine-binding chemotaxis protein CheW